jgi:heterodisulfide reductase subunit A-like polyferredoxin
MDKISSLSGCTIEVSNRPCSVSKTCDICGYCDKHCLEHMQNRFGFRMINKDKKFEKRAISEVA